jgi:hypothetical protein
MDLRGLRTRHPRGAAAPCATSRPSFWPPRCCCAEGSGARALPDPHPGSPPRFGHLFRGRSTRPRSGAARLPPGDHRSVREDRGSSGLVLRSWGVRTNTATRTMAAASTTIMRARCTAFAHRPGQWRPRTVQSRSGLHSLLPTEYRGWPPNRTIHEFRVASSRSPASLRTGVNCPARPAVPDPGSAGISAGACSPARLR